MLHTETVEKGTLDIVNKLMADEKLGSFNLVGGTALALKIGHRKSVDIDLFSLTDFDSKELSNHLASNYDIARLKTITNGVFCYIDDVKVDILAHKYPLVEDLEITGGVRMVSLKDIGAMKLNAIYGSGTRLKDFVDMYSLLEKYSLKELLEATEKKYPDDNIQMVKYALLHHDDIDFEATIDYTDQEIEWSSIAERLREAIQDQQKIFTKPPPLKTGLLQKKNRPQQNRGRHL